MQSFVSLMYHNVTANGAAHPDLSPSVTSYFVDRDTFAAQMQELQRLGRCQDWEAIRRFYTFDDIETDRLLNHRPAVQISFDDGWMGSVDVAGPILESHRFQAMLFVTTDLVGRDRFVTATDLQQLPPQTFRVGSHAKTHRLLNRLNEHEIRNELHSSKQSLEDIVGYEIDTLSIPGGAVDARVRRIADELGYRYLCTSRIHANSRQTGPLHIGRIAIKQATALADFRHYVCHRLGRERLRQSLLSVPKQVLGRKLYDSMRRRLLGEAHDQQEMVDLSAYAGQVQAGQLGNVAQIT